jgi:neurotransmitter:Na+ symporter, NSS family
LVFRALTLEGAMAGVEFFLKPDFSKMTSEGILYALGQSFFALAVGFSCMVTYSSYLGKNISIPKSAGIIAIMNIFVSILAGLAIFPVVFAFGFEPTGGPGLLFIVLPAVFSKIAFGEFFLALFLILFLFATLTSSFSLLEIVIAAFTSDGKRSRTKVSWIAGLVVFVVGIPAGLSSGILSEVTLFDKNVFDLTDYLVSNILLPLGCLLIALIISLKIDRNLLKEEFNLGLKLSNTWYNSWWVLMRFVVPITICIVFLNTLGII